MKECRTIRLLHEASGCLVHTPICPHAQKLGFSYICCHPDHTQFHAHVTGTMTNDEALARYSELKKKRRIEFLASLNEEHKSYFNYSKDFYERPLADLGQQLNGNNES